MTTSTGKKRSPARLRAEVAAIRLLHAIALAVPGKRRLAVARAVGRLAFRIDKRRRGVAIRNIELAYPEQPSSFHLDLALASFEHLGRILFELLALDREAETLYEQNEIEGWEHLESAVALGRGYFLLSGHYGNWELIAHQQSSLGKPLWMITRPLDNPRLEQMLASVRGSSGTRIVHKRNAVREMMKAFRAGEGVAIAIDQSFSDKSAHWVTFFGRPAATAPTVGVLAARMGLPIVPVFSFPKPEGGYRIVYETPIFAPEEGSAEERALAVTIEATQRAESAIRKQPQAWFWMHRRWKRTPET